MPPNTDWLKPGTFVITPNGGIVYTSTKWYFTYMTAPIGGKRDVHIINAKETAVLVDCDPDWSQNKYVAIFDTNRNVCIWDLDIMLVVKGHKGHTFKSGRIKNHCYGEYSKPVHYEVGALCYLKNRDVFSTFGGDFIRYCVTSNTYTNVSFATNVFEQEIVNIMVPSPYADNIVAMGTKRGLIAIVNIQDRTLLYRLRGHDYAITALEWMQVEPTVTASDRPQLQAKTKERQQRGPPIPIVDEGDIFDIHQYDDGDEFGASARPPLSSIAVGVAADADDAIPNIIDHLDFMDACQTLKEDILLGLRPPSSDPQVTFNDLDSAVAAAKNAEISNDIIVESDEYSLDGIIVANEYDVEIDDDQSSLAASNELDIETLAKQQSGPIVFLASGSMNEAHIWLWNTVTGIAEHKIQLPTKKLGQNLSKNWLLTR